MPRGASISQKTNNRTFLRFQSVARPHSRTLQYIAEHYSVHQFYPISVHKITVHHVLIMNGTCAILWTIETGQKFNSPLSYRRTMTYTNETTNSVNDQHNAPSIGSSSMLCELSISTWTGRKKDKRASEDVTTDNHAASGVASVHRSCLPIVRNSSQYRSSLPTAATCTTA